MKVEYSNKDFLDWYFGGSDQEQEQTLMSLGEWAKDMLMESKKCIIEIQDLKDNSNIDLFYDDMEYLKTE